MQLPNMLIGSRKLGSIILGAAPLQLQSRRSLTMKSRMNQDSAEHKASKSDHQSSVHKFQKAMRTDRTEMNEILEARIMRLEEERGLAKGHVEGMLQAGAIHQVHGIPSTSTFLVERQRERIRALDRSLDGYAGRSGDRFSSLVDMMLEMNNQITLLRRENDLLRETLGQIHIREEQHSLQVEPHRIEGKPSNIEEAAKGKEVIVISDSIEELDHGESVASCSAYNSGCWLCDLFHASEKCPKRERATIDKDSNPFDHSVK